MGSIDRVMSRGLKLAALTAFCLLVGFVPVYAVGNVFQLDIPATEAEEALDLLAEKTGHSLFYPADELKSVTTNALGGSYTLPEALDTLLKGTHLNAVVTDKGVIVVSRIPETKQVTTEERNVKIKPKKQSLLSKVVLVLFGAGTIQAAMAQDSNDTASEPIEEIVVFGSHLQNQRAIDTRRNSPIVVDAVSSDDVGRLPDFNVGEALQRLPGIAIQNDQAEARFVTVRALNADYNYTTVDGVSMAVPDRNGRKVFMDILPASLAQRIDVNKTFTPNMEGNAIGGIIDIRTASAFSSPANTFNFNAEIGTYENDEGYRSLGPSGAADISYSTIFGDSDQFGLVLAGNYYRRDSTIPQSEWSTSRSFFDAAGNAVGAPDDPPYKGNGFPVPNQRAAFYYHNDRVRYGGTAKFEIRLTEDQQYFVRAFWNTSEDDEARQTDNLEHNGGQTITNHTATSGTITTANRLFQRHLLGQFDFERSVWQIAGGGNLSFDNGSELSIRLNYSGSSFKNFETFRRWEMRGDNDGDGVDDNAFSYEQRGDVYAFTLLDPDAHFDYSNFAFVRDDITDRDFDEALYEIKLDFSDDFGDSNNWRYGVGLSFRHIERSWDEDRDRNNPTVFNAFDLASTNAIQLDNCLQTPGFIGGECITTIDPDLLNENLAADMMANPTHYSFDEQTNNDFDEDYMIDEGVLAAYFMLQYSSDRANLIFGARYEDTSNDGIGNRNVAGVGWTQVTNSGGYDHFLPSVNFSYDLLDDIIFRTAFSKTIGRADFEFIAPVGEALDDVALKLQRSNPDLLPRESYNFDVGLDYYFDEGQGLIAANVFYKLVKNEIFRATGELMLDIYGATEEVTVTQPVNNGKNTDILGIELQVVKNLDFLLPGLGFSANATFLDTNFQVFNERR